MTSINHILTGAAVALAISNPVVAIAVAFLSHFVLDAIPHFGPSDTKDVFERNKRLSFKIGLIAGIATSLLSLVWLIASLQGSISLVRLAACILAALLPDIIWIPRFFSEIRSGVEKPKERLATFHAQIQRNSLVLGAINELLWFTLMVLTIKGLE